MGVKLALLPYSRAQIFGGEQSHASEMLVADAHKAIQREQLRSDQRFLAIWAMAVILAGGALMSYHQPFQVPSPTLLSLVKQDDSHQWMAVHVLSGSCNCSQRIMRHLLARRPSNGFQEQVLMVDGEEPALPDTGALLANLQVEGFSVIHIAAKNISSDLGLRGLPLLVLASPGKKVAYLGGYGSRGDQDERLFQQVRSGQAPKALAVIGCAVGARLRRKADPLHLKY